MHVHMHIINLHNISLQLRYLKIIVCPPSLAWGRAPATRWPQTPDPAARSFSDTVPKTLLPRNSLSSLLPSVLIFLLILQCSITQPKMCWLSGRNLAHP